MTRRHNIDDPDLLALKGLAAFDYEATEQDELSGAAYETVSALVDQARRALTRDEVAMLRETPHAGDMRAADTIIAALLDTLDVTEKGLAEILAAYEDTSLENDPAYEDFAEVVRRVRYERWVRERDARRDLGSEEQ